MILKLAFAFGAGFISFLTPCVLPIIPGYISYITGKNLNEIEQDKKIVLIKTILFSFGFSLGYIKDMPLAKSGKIALGIGLGYGLSLIHI